MEDNKPSLLKHAMSYGAIIGLTLVVYSIILYITGTTFHKGQGLIQYVVLFTGIFIGTKAYRDKALNGFITYGRALWLGIVISVFVGIITVFFNFIMIRFIDPGLVDKYMAVIEEQFENSRFIPAEQMDTMLEKARQSMTSVRFIPVSVLTFSFIGFIISLITSIFVKREPNPMV